LKKTKSHGNLDQVEKGNSEDFQDLENH